MLRKLLPSTFAISMLFVSSLSASTLEIYNDGAKYRYIPMDNYVGFSRGASASCEDQSIALLSVADCSDKKRLCKEISIIKEIYSEAEALKHESSTLDQLIAISSPTAVDATKWIDAAQKIGKRKAELGVDIKSTEGKLETATDKFKRQAPSTKAMMTESKCIGKLEINIPAGYIEAHLLYEADVSSSDSIHITQYLALNNHSGIDIVAKEAYIYARNSRLYLRPQHFRPWTASVRENISKAKRIRALSVDAVAPIRPVPALGNISQSGFKSYHISGVELPSTGKDIKVKIADYKAVSKCEYIAHPYRDSKVYRACSFTPNSAIEANQWTIKKNKRLVSKEAYGEYWEGKYLLSTDIDNEVLIIRSQVVKQDQSSGIFGGAIRKRDGFEIDIANIYDKVKSIKIIERIPRSTTDKIEIKLVSVDGVNSYKLVEDGKLVIDVKLNAKEHKKIKVIFELEYDKKLKVNY